jgi:hypothetical protein
MNSRDSHQLLQIRTDEWKSVLSFGVKRDAQDISSDVEAVEPMPHNDLDFIRSGACAVPTKRTQNPPKSRF